MVIVFIDGTSFFQSIRLAINMCTSGTVRKDCGNPSIWPGKLSTVPDTKSLEDFLFNEQAQLHNSSIIPDAHSLDLGTLISKLNLVPNTSLLNLQKRLAKRMDQVNDFHKQAILVLLEGIELVQLRTRVPHIMGLAQVVKQDPSIFERLEE
ncbi:hypothetical protein [Paenibacillus taichungensis]|uniref:hypothetical protein n=1 Tax=Paenibacillus taichungensis TaxID=484184 RepID=UPI0038D19FCA